MNSINGLIKLNNKTILGIIWFIILIIFVADRLLNNLEMRLLVWIGGSAIFISGLLSIIEGLKLKKK